MADPTERERAIAEALYRAYPNYPNYSWAVCLDEVRGFIAMLDAARAFDAAHEPKAAPVAAALSKALARLPKGQFTRRDLRDLTDDQVDAVMEILNILTAQEPKATAQPEPSVVEAVEKALESLRGLPDHTATVSVWSAGFWRPLDPLDRDQGASTILNNVPALLELAKRGGKVVLDKMCEAHGLGQEDGLRVGREEGYREGVIKGLERAARQDQVEMQSLCAHVEETESSYARSRERQRSMHDHQAEITRIRSGGEIEPSVDPTSTGGTPATATKAAPNASTDASVAPEQPNPAAGGAPQELPKGWLSEGALAFRDMDRRWVQQWGVASLPADEVVRLLGMARAALALREAARNALRLIPQIVPNNREGDCLVALHTVLANALASLDKPNG